MGNYNPNAPIILGQEWVPIQEEDFFISPAQNVVEVGYQFTTTAARVLQDARFYVNKTPQEESDGQVYQVSIYTQGTERSTGPVHQVMIPVSSGSITGNAVLGGSYTVAQAMLDPSDGKFVSMSGGSPADSTMLLWFATNGYSQLLNGKRILSLDLVYVATSTDFAAFDARFALTSNPSQLDEFIYARSFAGGIVAPEFGAGRPEYSVVSLGEITPFWTTTPLTTVERLPWNYGILQRFEPASANLITTRISGANNSTGTSMDISYMALRVTYCEETRLAVGGVAYGEQLNTTTGAFGGIHREYVVSTNIVPLRSITAFAANPVLAAGTYSVVLSSPDQGPNFIRDEPYPTLNSLRELYALPAQEGVQVNVTKTVDQQFTREQTHVIPQLTVHTSGGPLTEIHPYGRQSVAQVYGTITATQEVLDSVAGASFSYPWVRYYARRWGDTTVPLRLDSASASVSGSGMGVLLSAEEFDDLPEIVDGWKQITLRFPTAPAMGTGTTPTWRWSASGETAGNRWEVLGAAAPAISGIVGNLQNLVPSPHQLSSATYGAPTVGATVNEGWIPQLSPYVSATADDQTSDAVLIFSQDPPAVSGFVVSTLSQAVSGIGLDCGLNPCGIPSEIYYNRLSWTPDTSQVAFDDFNRTSASGWGVMSSGQTWTAQGGAATDHIVSSGFGQHVMPSLGNPRRDVVGSFVDTEVQVTSSIPVLSTGVAIQTGILLRSQDSSNHYEANLIWNTNNTVSLRLVSRIAGTATTLVETTIGWYTPGDSFTIKARIDGNVLYAKAWKYDGEEPTFWQVQAVSTTITAAGGVGLRSEAPAGNTNTLPFTVSYDNFTNVPVTSFVYEVQRADTVDTGWETIMLGNPTVSGFSDFEARVGIVSSYRIREVNAYGFYGAWSSVVSATIPDPGLVAGCVGDGHVLLFSSNSRQDGSANLGYLSVWEGGSAVDETFTFPEAGWVQLQSMYNKDFYTAFRPLERGGDQFQRNVLVQAAAISPETLADFVDLRDMAWDTVPYVCVRDEDGNRWFATVIVPSAHVQLNRSIYVATVNIVEVTGTPTAVSP